jgi:RNA polymerase sigma factor (sigma-70 family)
MSELTGFYLKIKTVADIYIKNTHSSVLYDEEDAFQEGAIGYLEAQKHYDDSWKTKFSTYAYHKIKFAIKEGRRTVDKKRIVDGKPYDPKIVSLDDEAFHNDSGENVFTYAETIPDESIDLERDLYLKQVGEILQAGIATLKPKQQKVMVGLFIHEKSGKEMAEELNCTEANITTLKNQAVYVLRKYMTKHNISYTWRESL